MSVVARLLRIKEFRERKAEAELLSARSDVRAAEEEVGLSKKRWRDYQNFLFKEEKRLFSELYNRLVKLSDIEEVREQVAGMKKREIHYEELFNESEHKLSECRKVLVQKQRDYEKAMRVKQKFIELQKVMKENEAIEFARLSDEEMDEIALSLQSRQEVFEDLYESEGAL